MSILITTIANPTFDPVHEAEKILTEHTCGALEGVIVEPTSNAELLDHVTEECAFLLTSKLLAKEYTPMQYIAVRNELSKLLWDTFGPAVEQEREVTAAGVAAALGALIGSIT